MAACATNVFYAFGNPAAASIVYGNPNRRTRVFRHADAAVCAASLMDAGYRVAVLARTHARLVVVAYAAARLAPTLVSRIAFHTGGPFAHIDNDAGLYAVLDVCALATQRSGATGVPSQFDVINNLREKSAPFEALRELVRTNRLTTDPGPDWAGVLRLIDVVGVETLERAAVLLASCVRADAPPGTAQFVTIHASKGLSYPWVVLADDWGPRADAEASARECYVAITRSEDGLAIPASLHARLL